MNFFKKGSVVLIAKLKIVKNHIFSSLLHIPNEWESIENIKCI